METVLDLLKDEMHRTGDSVDQVIFSTMPLESMTVERIDNGFTVWTELRVYFPSTS